MSKPCLRLKVGSDRLIARRPARSTSPPDAFSPSTQWMGKARDFIAESPLKPSTVLGTRNASCRNALFRNAEILIGDAVLVRSKTISLKGRCDELDRNAIGLENSCSLGGNVVAEADY